MKSQTGVTVTVMPNAGSVLVYEGSSLTAAADIAASLVMSPTVMLGAYLIAPQSIPVNVPVEQLAYRGGLIPPVEEMPTAKAINKAHEDSGLTWEQLARIFGVSRRAVHMWANGARMNATNAELLMRLIGFLGQMEGGPDQRRATLLAIGDDGKSALDRFRSQHTNLDRRFDSLPRPDTLLGALHENRTP
jgi:transcriptional regulator with XRE-family HTH domain